MATNGLTGVADVGRMYQPVEPGGGKTDPGLSWSPAAAMPPEDGRLDASFVLDVRGRIADWSDEAQALYGFSAHEVVGRHPTMLVPPDLEFERDERVREVLSGRTVAPYATERMRKDGSRLEVAVDYSPVRDATGHIAGVRAEVREIGRDRRVGDAGVSGADTAPLTHGERSQRRLADAQARFRVAFLHAPNGIALLSTALGSEGSFLDANPALAAQLGCEAEDLIGRCLLDFLHSEPGADPETLRALLAASDGDARPERRFRRGDGRDVWLQIGASVVRDDVGRPLYAVAHLQDVTDARRHQAELQRLADHDGLTGLVNRRCFGARLDATLAEARDSGTPAAVLVLDLDNFKAVNDTCGHAAGDELLRRVAIALRSRVRSTDVVARLGGDEFGILLTDVTPERARSVAAELLAAVNRQARVSSNGRHVRVTASIGVSTVDGSLRLTGEALLGDADSAMYAAKRTGRNRLATGAAAERRAAPVSHDRRRSSFVAAAATTGRLKLWEQPQLDLRSGAQDRVELLARMRGRDGEEIPASRFLPVLKRFGRAQDVDRWVLEAAVALVGRRRADGAAGDVEINLDAASITDERFVDHMRATLMEAFVDPRAITFAITAAASISDLGTARRLMASLGDLGCRFALDHFGASAGSLRDLKHLPFDVVKIDGELISGLPEHRFGRLAVSAIADLARGGGLTTVAEHVTDDATLQILRDYGIDYAQGFHVAPPRPVMLPGELLAAA